MRIIIIRHGDPDNGNQTLTEQGFKEVEALKNYYKKFKFKEAYVSPLARAQITADAFLSMHHQKAIQAPWLAEFKHFVKIPGSDKEVQNWDFMPSYFTKQNDLYNNDKYLSTELMKSGNVEEEYNKVIEEFDRVLKKNGYRREGKYYAVEKANEDTIIFFCHFGMMSVLMSHLMNIPYVVLTQVFCCQPTGVTTLVSEEREQGIAQFRCLTYGDITHLNVNNIEPSFHGRFCEIYDSDQRH